jgi:hypothetical protein
LKRLKPALVVVANSREEDTMTADKSHIAALENDFWTAMRDKDPGSAKELIARECLVTGPMGTMRLDPDKFAQLTVEGKWRLDTFQLSDVEVSFPAENVGVIIYKVHQTGELKGEPMDFEAADSTVWVHEDSSWKVALHTETMLEKAREPEPA